MWLGEFEYEEVAAGTQDAAEFGQRAMAIGHVAETEGNGGDVETFVGEGQRETVALAELDVVRVGRSGAFLFGFDEHGSAEVHADDLRLGAEMTAERERDVAAAGGEIEDVAWVALGDGADELAAPMDIGAEAEEPVRDIVATCDATEHGVYGVRVGHQRG